MEISFKAYEYQQDELFYQANFRFKGSCEKGWQIFRDEKLIESPGPGYVLLKSLCCGVCSTDIARAKLPFPLPQVTGHEVIALYQDKPVAVEINASHIARGIKNSGCYYCEQGMGEHCPDRLTLGIDRLPGGFSPYILAPQNAIKPLPESFDIEKSAIIEPFAAALHAVETSHITNGMKVAIVGPKRLGLLLLFALYLYRKKTKTNFTISAVIRHKKLSEACLTFGADEVLLLDEIDNREFDVVYDTSGSVSGFQLSMLIAKSTVHVKSTHGMEVGGFTQLTRLVIDELSLMPLTESHFDYLRSSMLDENKRTILIDVGVPNVIKDWIEKNFPARKLVECNLDGLEAKEIEPMLPIGGFGKFDVALLVSMDQLNKVMDFPGVGNLLRAQGDIHWYGKDVESPLLWQQFFQKNLKLQASRCGKFSPAIRLIADNSALFSEIISKYISGCYALSDINQAFDVARKDANSIKLLIKHSQEVD